MSEINKDWVLRDQPIRRKILSKMVSITDLWKSEGSPSNMRPDKWIKSDSMQDKLSKLALLVDEGVKKDDKGNVIGIPGVLEIIRGGRYSQGTFASYTFGAEYAKFLSDSSYQWYSQILSTDSVPKTKQKKSQISFLSINTDEFKGKVRVTPDGRVSVYDAIGYTTGHKNPRQVWNDLTVSHPVFVQKTDKYKFPGVGGKARPTPVATLQVFLEILTTLPGRIAATVREQAVSTLIRAMEGDPTLVEEIMDRMKNPDDLRAIEESARVRRVTAYGDDVPSGTLSSPLTEITPDIKNGYGWINKTPTMISLLIDLATHVGDIIIQKDSPHRPYSKTGKSGKSRIIPLTLKSIKDLNILHIYWFDSTFVDDTDVVEIFQKRAYPEIAYRDFKGKGIEIVVAHIVSPGGITKTGVERMEEAQKILDAKYRGKIQLNSMRLDELVWGYMYPAIAERYEDSSGKFALHHLNMKVKSICKELCSTKVNVSNSNNSKENTNGQLSLFDLLPSELCS